MRHQLLHQRDDAFERQRAVLVKRARTSRGQVQTATLAGRLHDPGRGGPPAPKMARRATGCKQCMRRHGRRKAAPLPTRCRFPACPELLLWASTQTRPARSTPTAQVSGYGSFRWPALRQSKLDRPRHSRCGTRQPAPSQGLCRQPCSRVGSNPRRSGSHWLVRAPRKAVRAAAGAAQRSPIVAKTHTVTRPCPSHAATAVPAASLAIDVHATAGIR